MAMSNSPIRKFSHARIVPGSPGQTMPVSRPPRRARGRPPAALDRARMGQRLRAIRKAQGLTLKALSVRSGVALSTLSKIELGQISVSYEKLAAVARSLAVDTGAL